MLVWSRYCQEAEQAADGAADKSGLRRLPEPEAVSKHGFGAAGAVEGQLSASNPGANTPARVSALLPRPVPRHVHILQGSGGKGGDFLVVHAENDKMGEWQATGQGYAPQTYHRRPLEPDMSDLTSRNRMVILVLCN
jgi:hypothetical protein